MLARDGGRELSFARSCGEARRAMMERPFDLCVINAPLPDEFGDELAMDTAERGAAQVMLIVRGEMFGPVSERVEDHGVFTLAKPLTREQFWGALKLVAAASARLSRMRNEYQRLEQKLEDTHVVNRAKFLLMRYMSLTEPEAHRYIEKRAMDMRLRRRDVAQTIIKTYER
jgi:response regulator NasT